MARVSRRRSSALTDVPALRRALGLPDDLHFVAVVTMGYPAEADDASNVGSVFSQRRKQRSEVVRWERWS